MMHSTAFIFLSVLFIFSLVQASPQGVYDLIAPPSPLPAGCQNSYGKRLTFAVAETAPGRIGAVQDAPGILSTTLRNGVLTDRLGRIGSIVANRQLQFDGPPAQAGAIYTSGWGVCTKEGILALGSQTIFYKCMSGNFHNIYDQSIGGQCTQTYLAVDEII